MLLAGWVLFETVLDEGMYHKEWCFTNTCISNFYDKTSQSFAIVKIALDLSVAVATIGGIFVALLNYISAANNYALTNHIGHLKIFGEHIDGELKKLDRLTRRSFDILRLYNVIFHESRDGKTTVSNDYIEFVGRLNKLILKSNEQASRKGGFSYKEHQYQMKTLLKVIGIEIHLAPRNHYFEMEDQLCFLIDNINRSFCPQNAVPALESRLYM